ncbi:UDP-N-acetylmuramate dehydrogenase [Patescibacteria group bacterium]|nr:UDP-N-acetylmuramate dehydrogenase [Patescibacteria group bacterium]MDE1944198.1 UDP-N-acetylmuramate dehydrogenase [Patescibacteria group bacterium]MDE1945499.1 UDP-N-acetylmuramate dehydrogenase [Patescibacteria group bacterium]
MTPAERVPLAPLTSFGVGGAARFFAEARSVEELAELADFARAHALPLRLLASGTNILVPDAGVEALVVRVVMDAVAFEEGSEGRTLVVAEAGARWDALVDAAAARGLWGLENLAGIPGSAGGALVQNIGAYGAEFARVFAYADVVDLASGEERRVLPAEAALGYRTSRFKSRRDLAIVRVAMSLAAEGVPDLAYADLARAKEAGVSLATPVEVARAVRAIRAEKFPATGCAGSFFQNPIVRAEKLAELRARYPELPAYPVGGGAKIPLAWLLDHALHLKGYAEGPVRLFERQPLVVVASEGARAADVEALAREIEARVADAFGIALTREVETFA